MWNVLAIRIVSGWFCRIGRTEPPLRWKAPPFTFLFLLELMVFAEVLKLLVVGLLGYTLNESGVGQPDSCRKVFPILGVAVKSVVPSMTMAPYSKLGCMTCV